ncbi:MULTISPECIES: 2'-5' RNA ligase family protein [unclassified Amycolatopsis]|uniref:2'-5' RNA ligase family protein n=1 Tax=unclassified Amycolatopsis TaxID=2618356 RepID=UPI001FF127B7|nr:2'-5' RNA ligase family protein [Amycolatopsis sp. FBCC-B4732]UOX91724.1 2'-5' RNA ligase family protein [Amycolatopsis sp. FBCC-B4732]
MPEPGTTALVILLPAAEPVLAAARRVDPALVRPGLPAHVTALYPFLPAAEVSDAVLDAVRALAATFSPTEVPLTEFVTAPGFAAIPAPALQPVTDAVCARWPEVRPYGGRFGPRPGAHVTVAMGGEADVLERVAAEVRPLLPLTDQAAELQLVALTDRGWEPRLSARFGG